MSESIDQAIRRFAGAHANVATAVACEGTSLEATTFNVGGKAFLFLRTVEGGQEVRLKLGASRDDVAKLGEQWPDSYSVGSSGWAKLIISEERSLELVEKWIAESYGLIAGGKGSTGKVGSMPLATSVMARPARKPAAKQPATKKNAAKKTSTAKKKPATKKKPAAKKKPATRKKPAANNKPVTKKKPAAKKTRR